MAPKLKINMQTIADEFNISKVTVSKALNDKDDVSVELKEKIKKRAEELGYRMNYLAKGLKNNKTYNIGLLVAERYVQSTNNYYFEVETKLVRKLSDIGYTSIIEVLDKKKEDNLVLPNMYLDNKIDALIIIGECRGKYLKLFVNFPLPVLFFDFVRRDIDVDCIISDNLSSSFDLTRLLIKNGHKVIAFVGNIYSTASIKDRFLGYYRAFLDNNLELENDLIISDRDEYGELKEIILPKTMPTAFVCNNDFLAWNLVQKLKKEGINVPEDVSVVAFDNTIYSKIGEVKLTSCDNNVEQMIEQTVKIIQDKINDPTLRFNCTLVRGTIIERDSVKNITNI